MSLCITEGRYVVRITKREVRNGWGGEIANVTFLVLTSNNHAHPAGVERGWAERVLHGAGRYEPYQWPSLLVEGAVLGLRVWTVPVKPDTYGKARGFAQVEWLDVCPVHDECTAVIEMACACMEATRGQQHV